MNVQKMASLRPICRREFLQLCAGSLALATVGCDRDRALDRNSTVTVLHPGYPFAPLSYAAQFLVFLPLFTYDVHGELEGRLAERWDHSPDYRTWTIQVRKEVKWHDGVPVTAHDIKFTLDLFAVLFPGGTNQSTTVLDDSTVTIRSTPATDILDWWTVYYPKHLLEKLDPKEFWNWEFWKRPMGNGPYRYVRHIPGTMVELGANPDYYRGKPKIERVILKFGGSAPLPELLSGNVDALAFVNRADLPKLREDPRFRIYHGTFRDGDWLYVLVWNHRDPLFSEPRVRHALTLAIDRHELHQTLNLANDLRLFDVLFTGRQYRNGDLAEPVPHDPDEAKQFLEQASWRDVDGDGIREQDSKQFRFTALAPAAGGTDASSLDQAAVYVQAKLRRVGVHMDIQPLGWSVVQQRVKSGNFQAAFVRMQNQTGAREGHFAFFGEGSWIGYRNPKVIALLQQAQATMNPDELDRIYHELTPIFQADLPATFLYPSVYTTVAHRRLRGLSSPWRVDPVEFMEHLWLEDASQQ